ncbi:MAG: 50S ribosomal protein L13 [Anaerolineae bacterium]|nr:50S ribosomal protein L13 [Anaerolineae bacterium]
MKTFSAKKEDVVRQWYVVDATDQTLGRMATQIATILRGKNKPIYTPHLDCGDYVIVVNAEKIRVTGNKLDEKFYHRHSGYPGGLTSISLRDQLRRHPDRVITDAVRRMLPKNLLAGEILKKLKVYAGSEHPHSAQNPEPLKF